MTLIDKRGERPVCLVCRSIGSYAESKHTPFLCAACRRVAEANFQKMAEVWPEMRDHRLKRWRTACDCNRCEKRRRAVI